MKMSFALKILGLVISLVLVIFAIRSLNSPSFQDKASDPNSALSMLIGGESRPFNWCPEGTETVDMLDAEGKAVAIFNTPADLSALCEIMIGAAPAEEIEKLEFKKLLVASAKESSGPVILEKTVEKPIFRVHGMPFSSKTLENVLDRKQLAD